MRRHHIWRSSLHRAYCWQINGERFLVARVLGQERPIYPFTTEVSFALYDRDPVTLFRGHELRFPPSMHFVSGGGVPYAGTFTVADEWQLVDLLQNPLPYLMRSALS